MHISGIKVIARLNIGILYEIKKNYLNCQEFVYHLTILKYMAK